MSRTPLDEAATAIVTVSADGTRFVDISAPITSVDIEDHDRLSDKATVIFDDHTAMLAQLSFEGLHVRIGLGWYAETQMIFEGIVTESKVLATPTGTTVKLTSLDFTSLMTKRTFDPMEWRPGETLSTVLTRVVSRPEYHLVPFQILPATDLTLDERRPARPANINEWEFILDQAERQGCLAFVEYNGRGSSNFSFVPITRVAAADPIGTLRFCRGVGELIEFDYERVSSGAIPVREASSIDPTSGAATDQPAPEPEQRPPLPPPATERRPDLGADRRAAVEALAELAAAADARLAAPTERVSGQPAATATDLTQRTRRDPTRVIGLSGRGTATGTVLLRAKSRVTIQGVAPWAEGDWYVTKVNHIYTRERAENRTRSGYFSKFTATR